MRPEQKRYLLENINRKSIKNIAQELSLKERKIRKFLKKYRQEEKQKRDVPKRIILAHIILITILGLLVYMNSLKGDFIRDDNILVKNNIYIKNWSNIGKIFTTNIGEGGGEKWNSYRPLQMVTYMIDYSFWKLDVRGYHLTNTLLHILVAVCIYWLINILFADNLLSLFTSIFFVVHPIHTETVAYISDRADLLVGLFILLCFIFYIKKLHSIMLLSFIFALLSRENSLVLPVLLLLYHYTFKKKVNLRILPLGGIILVYILLRVTVLRNIHHIVYTTTIFQRIPGFFVAITNYLKLIFLPFNLHAGYGDKLFKFSHPQAICGIGILILLLIYSLKVRRAKKIVFFSVTWFFITLLPHSNLYPINAYMAEHWLYLPSVGFFLISARILSYLCRRKEFQIFTIVFLISLLTLYSYLTLKQNTYWKDPITFYERTLRYSPDNYRDSYNFANFYRNMGKYDAAVTFYKRALEINPDYIDAYNNLGLVYIDMGKKEEAILLFKKAIELNPNYINAYNNLGMVYSYMGKSAEAVTFYKKALEINPRLAEVYNNLGLTYSQMRKNKEAIESFKKAIEIEPNCALAHGHLAIVYYNEKNYDLAIKYCDKAIELGYRADPEFLELLKVYRRH